MAEKVNTALNTIKKSPTEIRIIDMEFAEKLGPSETLTGAAAVSVEPTGQLAAVGVVSGSKVQLTLSSGNLDVDYEVKVSVGTTAGQTLEGVGKMHVRLS